MFVSFCPVHKLTPLDGFCLRHPCERQGSLEFLTLVEKRLGWPTSQIIQALEAEWGELQALDAWSPRF
jgi:hypothetical protein